MHIITFDDFYNNEHYRFIAEKILEEKQTKSFLNDYYSASDLDYWKAETKKFLRDNLHYDSTETDFNEYIAEDTDMGSYRRLKIYFNSAPGCRVPAYLLIPKNLNKPAPAVVVLHDHGGMFYWGKEKSVEKANGNPYLESYLEAGYSGLPVASELAKRGYVTLVTDSLFFGERRYDASADRIFSQELNKYEFESKEYISEFNRMALEAESDVVMKIFYSGQTFMGIRTRDDIASVSYLAGRPEVDAEKIACAGLSMGGHRAGWLHALDDRVKCGIIAGWMAKLGDMAKNLPQNSPWMWVVPGMHGTVDYPDVVSLAVPKPLYVIHGEKDYLFNHKKNENDERCTGEAAADVVKKVYEKAGCGDKFTFVKYDAPHEFNAEMQKNAYEWLEKNI